MPEERTPVFPKSISVAARERYLDRITRKWLPADLKSTLSAAISGDLDSQTRMFWAMIDTWPRLQSNIGDMQEAVAGAPLEVKPFIPDGASRPTRSAVRKANMVRDSLANMRADPVTNELGAHGLVKNVVFGFYASPQLSEIYWEQTGEGVMPYAAKAISPRYYGYSTGVGRSEAETDKLFLFPDGMNRAGATEIPRNQFVISSRLSFPGHPTEASPLRALTPYWLAANFGIEWFMSYAQLFGVPFRWATSPTPDDVEEVGNMLDKLGSAGWGSFPPGTEIMIDHSNANAASIPQAVLIELADKKCDIWVRGETLTSDEGSSGSRSLGEVHERQFLKRRQALARYSNSTLTDQLSYAIVEENFPGDVTEVPEICYCVPAPIDELEQAERIGKLTEIGLPMTRKWVYSAVGVDMPEEDEELFEPVKPEPPAPPPGSNPPAPPGAPPKPGNTPETGEPTEAARNPENIDTLVDNTLTKITGLQARWLAGVRPFFERLIAKAEDDGVTDEDFAAALTQAQRQLPDQFDRIDIDAMKEALDEAQASALVTGALDRLEEQ